MSQFLKRIHAADSVLSYLGWLNLFAVLVAACLAPWDQSAFAAGPNPWFKVMRYGLGLAIYAWTLALFIQHLPGPAAALRAVRWGTFACLTAEIAALLIQAIRGVPSHYNITGEENAAIFAAIAGAILLNTLIAFGVLFLFLWQDVDLPRAYLMGIRLGFVMFIIGSFEGMIMILNQTYRFGSAGDLRGAHLAGIFGVQALPLAGYALHRVMQDRQVAAQLAIVTAIAGLWVLLFVRLFERAMAGQALLPV